MAVDLLELRVDDGDLVDLDLLNRGEHRVENRIELLQQEDGTRRVAGGVPGLDELSECDDVRLTILDKGRGVSLGLSLKLGLSSLRGLNHIRSELALHLLQARTLHIEVRASTSGHRSDLGALLGHHRLATRLRVDDAALGFGLGDLHLRVDLGGSTLLLVIGIEHAGFGAVHGLGDTAVLQKRRRLLTTDRVEVALIIANMLNIKRIQLQPEARQVVLRFLGERLRKLDAVVVDLFRRQRRKHAAKIALERLLGDLNDLLAGHPQKTLNGVVDKRRTAADLDVGNPFHAERDTALGVRVGHVQLDDHVGHVETIDAVKERISNLATAVHDRIAGSFLLPGKHQHLVGLADLNEVGSGNDADDG